ncbi:MAG TPA: chemotaxis protein CheW [Gemmatimonadales bacterium]
MTESDPSRVVVCRIGAERFALPVEAVREILTAPPISRIPGVAGSVRGVANVRGTLVTAFSGPLLLGLEGEYAEDWLLVLGMCDGQVGVLLDEVLDLHTPAEALGLVMLDLEILIRPLLAPEAIKA